MPKDAILYTNNHTDDSEIVALSDANNELYNPEGAYVVLTTENGTVYYVPLTSSGYFLVPKDEVVIDIRVNIIEKELLEEYKNKHDRKNSLIAITLISLFIFFAFILPAKIESDRKKERIETIEAINNSLREKEQKKIQIAHEREQDKKDLSNRIAKLTEGANSTFVFSNVSDPIIASLSPNYNDIRLYLREINGSVNDDYRPIQDFLNNEDKHGYKVALTISGTSITFPQNIIYFSKEENSNNLDESGLTITTLTKHTDSEIEETISNNIDMTSRKQVEKIHPTLKNGYFTRQYRVSQNQLTSGKLDSFNFRVKSMTFDRENTLYFISSTNPRLTIEEQQLLLDKLVNNFNLPADKLSSCCSWKEVTFSK